MRTLVIRVEMTDPMHLYRAVSNGEFDDLMRDGVFRSIPGSLEGKWFAETPEHATAWGLYFTRLNGLSHDKIIVIELTTDAADKLYRLAMLDGIGPARYATLDQLHVCLAREFTA